MESINGFSFVDGTYRGSEAKEDVYVYRFKIRDIHGSVHFLDGHVSLLK
jgi:hypothetical protein